MEIFLEYAGYGLFALGGGLGFAAVILAMSKC